MENGLEKKPRKINLMVVEDSEVEAFILKNTLEELDYIASLTIYEKASEAFNFLLEAEESDLPDLILLDLYLDQGDGYEFMDEMEFSARFPDTFPFKVYILTNARWSENKSVFENQKFATGFFEKPINTSDFRKKVAEDFPAE